MPRKAVTLLLVVIAVASVVHCGETKMIDGVEYETYGLLNEGDKKNFAIAYEPIWFNIVWGVVFCETIIIPIYVFGYSLYQPVGKKPEIKGAVPQR